MSRSFILSVLFDHLFIRSTHPNTSVYITTQKSAIDLFTHSLSLRSPLCFPLLFSLHPSFSSFVLSSFGRHRSPPPHRSEMDVIDSEMN